MASPRQNRRKHTKPKSKHRKKRHDGNGDANETTARSKALGRHAKRPRRIPLAGWKPVLHRVQQSLQEDDLTLIAAGIAFYAFLSIFPAMAAALSLYGLLADPAALERQLAILSQYLPTQAQPVVQDQLVRIAAGPRQGLTWGALVSIAAALWAASRGTRGMMRGLNIAYDQPDAGNFLILQLKAIVLTLGAIISVAMALALIAVLPGLLRLVGVPDVAAIVSWGRWPLLAGLIILGLAVTYRLGPARRGARWKWLSWGSVLAASLWLLASALFSYYVANFAEYHETYGSIGGIIVLLLWLQISAFAVLLGAKLNAEIEAQTAVDPPQREVRR